MAGSYTHATTEEGKLKTPDTISETIENPGDAYETIEQMYGMIWYLATGLAEGPGTKLVVELAQKNWKAGIELSPGREGTEPKKKVMTDQQKPKPTTAPTILCKHCGHSIRRERLSFSNQWIHNWTFKRGCVGKTSEAEPQ